MRPSNAEIVRHHDDEPPEGASPYITTQDYKALKQPVLRGIYDRMFRAHGLL